MYCPVQYSTCSVLLFSTCMCYAYICTAYMCIGDGQWPITHATCWCYSIYIYIYIVCMCIIMCGATMHTCVVALSRQYGILTSSVNTVHVMYIVLSHSNKYNIIE